MYALELSISRHYSQVKYISASFFCHILTAQQIPFPLSRNGGSSTILYCITVKPWSGPCHTISKRRVTFNEASCKLSLDLYIIVLILPPCSVIFQKASEKSQSVKSRPCHAILDITSTISIQWFLHQQKSQRQSSVIEILSYASKLSYGKYPLSLRHDRGVHLCYF